MSDTPQKFYLTTPIYYVNARPHIGHAYSTIAADVIARRHRLLGDDTFFLTGTDEHGQKVQRSAAAAGIPPQQFTDQVSDTFRALWQRMGITNDDYIRTTDPRHKRGVQQLWKHLEDLGAIYLSSYTGQYSVGEEMFIDGPPGTIGPDGKPTETVTEENYFFRLSEYQLPVIDLIESGQLHIQPETIRNEVLSFLRGNVSSQSPGAPFMTEPHPGMSGNESPTPATTKLSAAGIPYVPGALKDLSISRTSFTWGIPVPGNEKHVIYVWLDALANYMTAVGYGSDDPADQEKFNRYWPADLHLVGKEITRFHCVYWPAFLLALNPKLQREPDQPTPTLTPAEHSEWAKKWVPKSVVANGWLLFEESKMSKSRGNVVRTETILDAFGTLCPPIALRTESPSHTSPRDGQTDDTRAESPSHTSPRDGQTDDTRAEGPSHTSLGRSPRDSQTDDTRAESPTHAVLTPPTKAQQDLFASDVLRYFLLREIPFGQDGSFSFDALVQRYNSDLANGYGNLVSRTLSMINKYTGGVINRPETVSTLRALQTADLGIGFTDMLGATNPLAQIFEQPKDVQRIREQIDESLSPWAVRQVTYLADSFEFAEALKTVARWISYVDGFITVKAPWKLAAVDTKTLEIQEVLYTAAESIRIITALLYPILPYATASVWSQLGLGDIEQAARNGELKNLQWGGLKPGTKLGPLSPIFPRADKGLIQIMADAEINNYPAPSKLIDEKTSDASPAQLDSTHPGAAPRTGTLNEPNPGSQVAGSAAITTERPGTPHHSLAPASAPFANDAAASSTPDTPQIAIDDFVKIDLRVAKIIVAERIPKADKLLRLEVDLGYETRQILSGIAEWYTPEELLGRRIVIIANLAPRKMRGLESHGMLLAASNGENGKPVLATFGEDIELGSRLK